LLVTYDLKYLKYYFGFYRPEEVAQLLSGKLALKYSGPEIEAMRAIALSAHKRSLADFQSAMTKFKDHLENDSVVKAHFATLYDKMMEQNLCRIIEPYSKVEVKLDMSDNP